MNTVSAYLDTPEIGYIYQKSSTLGEDLHPRTTALIAVTSRAISEGDVYVQQELRMFPGMEHTVDDCVTKAEDGVMSIANLSQQNINVSTFKTLCQL